MSIMGAPGDWAGVIDSMVPDILHLVVTTWATLPLPSPDEKEDDITNRLCIALRQNRTSRELMFYVQPQMVELEPLAGQDLGRMDIAFLPTGHGFVPREDIYFCLECKRLNVVNDGETRSYASEYVLYGMMRFVMGQYAKSVRHGGMLGYVLDGDVPRAIRNVQENVRARHAELRMDTPGQLEPSAILDRDARARETRHRRSHEPTAFRIHHLFMAGDPNRPSLLGAAARPTRHKKK
jgi:hypothetical protein